MIRKQCRHIGEASAVACVYNHDQGDDQNDQQCISFAGLDTLCHHYDRRKCDGQDEDQLVNGITILHGISPCREAETTACIEDSREGGNDTCRCSKSDTLNDHLLLRDQCKTAGDIDVEHQPDTDVVANGLRLKCCHDARLLTLTLGLMPSGGLSKEQVSDKHHNEIYAGQDPEHLVEAYIFLERLHDRACDSFCGTKACNGKTCCQTLTILKPEHQSLDRRKITGTEADTHDETIAEINTDQDHRTAMKRLTGASKENEQACQRHTCSKADGCNERGLMNILLYKISKESC